MHVPTKRTLCHKVCGQVEAIVGVYLSACKNTLAPHAAKANEKWLIKSFRPRPLRERPLTHEVSHEICLVGSHVTKHIKKWSLVRSFTDVKVGNKTRYRFALQYNLCVETRCASAAQRLPIRQETTGCDKQLLQVGWISAVSPVSDSMYNLP